MVKVIKQGDILNFSWKNPYGKLIKLHNYLVYGFNRDYKWTHSAIVGKVNKDTVEVYEALSDGFVMNVYGKGELQTYIDNGNLILGNVKKPLTNVEKNCKKYLGTPYGWLDIFHIGLYTLFGKTSFIFSTKAKKLICSEAVARILYDSSKGEVNFEKEFNRKYDLISPIDLYKSKQIEWRK